jgi:hypothetical protein
MTKVKAPEDKNDRDANEHGCCWGRGWKDVKKSPPNERKSPQGGTDGNGRLGDRERKARKRTRVSFKVELSDQECLLLIMQMTLDSD